MFPSAVGLLFVTVPPSGRASSMAKFFSITGAMTALGPILGSWLAPINWRLIFFVNVPLGLAALAALMVAHVPRTRRPARIDLAGATLSGAGMFLLVFALQRSVPGAGATCGCGRSWRSAWRHSWRSSPRTPRP
ncbi:multidrug efflux MFS transporter [Propionibacterium freudenreichii]|nr:multidrug efflux MFS transporter [Propionibacterium freudenreichii]